MIDSELFVFLTAQIPPDHHCIPCMSFSSEMSKKINVDPVPMLSESNHDFCDTKKEIKPSGLIRANHYLCFKYYETSFWPFYQRNKKKIILWHFPEL